MKAVTLMMVCSLSMTALAKTHDLRKYAVIKTLKKWVGKAEEKKEYDALPESIKKAWKSLEKGEHTVESKELSNIKREIKRYRKGIDKERRLKIKEKRKETKKKRRSEMKESRLTRKEAKKDRINTRVEALKRTMDTGNVPSAETKKYSILESLGGC